MFLDLGLLENEPLKVFNISFEKDPVELGWVGRINGDTDSRLTINMEAYYNRGAVYISGTMEAIYQAECSCCLEPFEKRMKSSFQEELSLHLSGGEREASMEDLEESLPVKGGLIDLGEYFRQLFELSRGLNDLCREDCLGICPVCGENRNKIRCKCEKENVDPRFSILQDLKDKLDKEENS
ncbi:MAG: DUF177 domain-containing protein [Firmicutes bacterium]|nr:DUF177 domain-containing protein [Bacillota bacterium]